MHDAISPAPAAAGLDSIAVRRTRSSNIEEHTQQLHDWNLDYDQLDCGRFSGQFTDIRLPGVQLFVESTTRRVRQRGELMPGSCGIGTMLEGSGTLCVNGVQSGVGALLACNTTELDMCTPPDCSFAGIVVDSGEWQAAAEAMACKAPSVRPGSLLSMTPPSQTSAPFRRMLLGAVQTAVDRPGLLSNAAARQRLCDDLMLSLIDAMSDGPDDGLEDGGQLVHRRKRMVDRACELILSRPDEPPTLLEVCRRIGASPRKLGYCFQDVLGLSPNRYIKVIRLNAVRRELCRPHDPEMSVYDAAARWGFWHFGHFSADYKKLFAELPSESLRRSRLQNGACPSPTDQR